MKIASSSELIKRRHFIARSCALGTSLCFGCAHLFSSANAQEVKTVKSLPDKYSQNAGMSYEQVFNFTYRESLIPLLVSISKQMGRDKCIELLKSATNEVYSQPDYMSRYRSNLPEQFWNDVLNLEVVENTPNLRIFKITKCLWAQTFREADASDIGYALLCYGDYASARLNNEKLERETTLMQGHEYCLLKRTKIEG
jgi:hypothetical protein